LARVRPVADRAGAFVDLKAAEPVVDVVDEAELAVLAVIDHIDAEFDLLPHDLADRALEPGLVGLLVARLRVHQVKQIRRPRQAAHVGGENPISAALHVFTLLLVGWAKGPRRCADRAHGVARLCPRVLLRRSSRVGTARSTIPPSTLCPAPLPTLQRLKGP